MSKRIIKCEQFNHGFPGMLNVDGYENCSFNGVYFVFSTDYTNVVFRNCIFSGCTYYNFVSFGGKVRFVNCTFRGTIKFGGSIGKGGMIKFTDCAGLFDYQFSDLRNRNQTLSEMGLYQIFKPRVLSKRKEETVYKKIGIFTLYNVGRYQQWIGIGWAIATLTIPKGTVRYGDRTGKCRCEKAMVTNIEAMVLPEIISERFKEDPTSFRYGSVRDSGHTVYEVGKEVKPNYFDYIPNKCSYGIHYFYDRRLAEAYDFR